MRNHGSSSPDEVCSLPCCCWTVPKAKATAAKTANVYATALTYSGLGDSVWPGTMFRIYRPGRSR